MQTPRNVLGEGVSGKIYDIHNDLIMKRFKRKWYCDASWIVEYIIGSMLPRHPNLIKPFSVIWTANEHPKITYKKYKKWDLAFIQNDLKISTIKKIASDVKNAITILHANGIIHADIRKQNIVFETQPAELTAILIDYGSSSFQTSGYDVELDFGISEIRPPEYFGSYRIWTDKIDSWQYGTLLLDLLLYTIDIYELNSLFRKFHVDISTPLYYGHHSSKKIWYSYLKHIRAYLHDDLKPLWFEMIQYLRVNPNKRKSIGVFIPTNFPNKDDIAKILYGKRTEINLRQIRLLDILEFAEKVKIENISKASNPSLDTSTPWLVYSKT